VKCLAQVDVITQKMLDVDTSPWDGLYPSQFHPNTGHFTNQHITFGARGDSFFEYLLKQWVLTGKKDEKLKRVYDRAMEVRN
jgi:mannosyl-oligosaccharide alpha-1,2-mannosidase